jgi:hypothetical protein
VGRKQIKSIRRKKRKRADRCLEVVNGASKLYRLRDIPEYGKREIKKLLMRRVASLVLNPQSLWCSIACGLNHVLFTQKENGELKIVPVPGIIFSRLVSEKRS